MSSRPPSEGIEQVLGALAEKYRTIRFARGVVGKTSYAAVTVLALWGIILWRLSDSAVLNGFLFAGGLIASGVLVWWVRSTQQFARDNPSLALLEGAELLEYQRFEAQVKGGLVRGKVPIIPRPDLPPLLPGDKDDEGPIE